MLFVVFDADDDDDDDFPVVGGRLVDFLSRVVFVNSPFEWTLSYLLSTARVHADVYAVRRERLPRVPVRGVLLVRYRSQVRCFFY